MLGSVMPSPLCLSPLSVVFQSDDVEQSLHLKSSQTQPIVRFNQMKKGCWQLVEMDHNVQ